ncbi:EFR1 family ferrodoxin [Mycoplasma sp. P36-A1]|uniref:EFR1 family ferrodoxin n=1 Tax=Mycoplasma sp. P36-A1 TaxID=3252900 RepID=UPI003C2C5FDF
MIFYFSATENCKYVAEKIVIATNDNIFSITECVNNDKLEFDLKNDELLGFVTPTYFWGLPLIVREFIKKLKLNTSDSGSHYCYSIATYDTTTGQVGRMLNDHLKERGFALDGYFSVKTPDTWTPMYDLSDKDAVKRTLEISRVQTEKVATKVAQNLCGDFQDSKMPSLAVKLFYPTYERQRKTEKFTVLENCIGCGLCAKKCPSKAIHMQENRPIWVKDKCNLCLGCLHRCPKFSIQYGKKTQKHGQYVNPNTKI